MGLGLVLTRFWHARNGWVAVEGEFIEDVRVQDVIFRLALKRGGCVYIRMEYLLSRGKKKNGI